MDMTFEQYIINPMGKNNAILSASVREITKKDYTRRFNNILLRENGKIDYAIYKGKGAVYFVHIKIPSEVVKNFYYDVVLKFTGSANAVGSMKGLDKYNVQFFSNDPAFVFTYAHVFKKNDLFIKELAKKSSKEALTKPPKEKNPNQLVGYVKSLYFAYLFMQQRGLFSSTRLSSAQPLDINYLLSVIQDTDDVIRRRQEEGKKVNSAKKTEVSSSTMSKLQKMGVGQDSMDRLVTTTSKTQSVKRNKAMNVRSTKKGITSKKTNKF